MKKLVLLDGHAIIHRAFHAIQPLNTSQGELVNAVFGFTSMLLNVLEIERPDYLAMAFDRKGKTFRHHADENYKATRAKTAPELIGQIRRVYEITRTFSIPIFSGNGFEADDLLGSICERAKHEKDLSIIVVSGDRDLLQLVNGNVSVHDLSGGYRKSVNFTPEKVVEKYGFPPKFIPDFKGLAGDASDNLKGVAGVGEKTARDLICEFGSLEEIYENLAKIRESVRMKLEKDRKNAFLSKRLATIRRDAQIEWRIEDCRLQNFDREKVLDLFAELEFHSLKKRFEKLFPTKVEGAEKIEQLTLF
ncbi:MAG: 5'-3' exonuclease H3TH domain-containing protein [Patescibacteria group bacterium]